MGQGMEVGERMCVCVCTGQCIIEKQSHGTLLIRSVLVSRSVTEPACVFCCYPVNRMVGRVVATVFAAVSLVGVPGVANVSTTFMS